MVIAAIKTQVVHNTRLDREERERKEDTNAERVFKRSRTNLGVNQNPAATTKT